MTTVHYARPATERSAGRGYLFAGFAVALLGVGLTALQFGLKHLFVPWYAPALATLGALLVLVAKVRRPTILRAIALFLIVGLAGLEWFFLGSLMQLPEYAGPVRTGLPLPAFASARADGSPFTDANLRDKSRHAMVFFRGRW